MTDIDRFYHFIIEKKLIKEGDRICVGISGGADSVCLLQFLYEISPELNISLYAFHVNHHLRGNESDSDQAFVEAFCEERRVPLKIYDYDAAYAALKTKRGLEETGRILRIRSARECAREFSADKIALAHHMNDCAETVLFNMARGSSLGGLKGIAAKNKNIIRPLLVFRKSEIEEALRRRNINWRTDSSNLSDLYARNRLRLNVLPYLEENINSSAVCHIASLARDIKEADDLIRQLARDKEAALTKNLENGVLLRNGLSQENPLLAGYIIMSSFESASGSVIDLKRKHISDIISLFNKQPGRGIDLLYRIRAERVYDGVVLSRKYSPKSDSNEKFGGVKLPNFPGKTVFGGFAFKSRIFNGPVKLTEIPKNLYTKWFDYDKLTSDVCLRRRKSGDYIVIDTQGHTKKIKDYFIDEKIPREKRDKVICLASGSKVLWIVGGRMGEDCKIDEHTSVIIEISAFKGDQDGKNN